MVFFASKQNLNNNFIIWLPFSYLTLQAEQNQHIDDT